MKTIKGQRLRSTLPDSQGERRDKNFLEDFVARVPPRLPLGQHHDAALPTVGYIENFRLEEVSEHPGEWCVVGDVHAEDNFDWSKHGGLSYSATEIAKARQDDIGVLFVPYPFYRDESILDEILSYDSQLSAGRWIKKEADPTQLTLMVCLFVLTPIWKSTVDEIVWPFIKRAWASYRTGRFKDMPVDFGFGAQGPRGEDVRLLFIPDRKNIEKTFTKELMEAGIEKAMKIMAEDKKGAAVGTSQIKLYYHDNKEGYRVTSIQYADGQEVNIV